MFFNIARYASYHKFFEKVRASAEKQEIDDPRLPRKRNVSNHYAIKFYIKQFDMVATVFVIDFSRNITLKPFRLWKCCF